VLRRAILERQRKGRVPGIFGRVVRDDALLWGAGVGAADTSRPRSGRVWRTRGMPSMTLRWRRTTATARSSCSRCSGVRSPRPLVICSINSSDAADLFVRRRRLGACPLVEIGCGAKAFTGAQQVPVSLRDPAMIAVGVASVAALGRQADQCHTDRKP
jgi:hypothetical protein